MTFQALYVHIPFCISKCQYCDFVSFPGCGEAAQSAYLDLVSREAALWQPRDFAAIRTIYVGGGTPTVLPPERLAALLAELRERCPLVEEVTVECNPGTISAVGLRQLRAAGATRLSVGVESFDDQQLRAMGRIHNAAEARALLKAARAAGFSELSMDLIYGLPGQTTEQWLAALRQAAALDIDHLSVYGLSLSEASPWGRLAASGGLALPDEEVTTAMMQEGAALLEAAGLAHYEIANYARPGHQCRHNLTYWRREDYLALGVAAAGLSGRRRWVNVRELAAYQQAVTAGRLPVGEEELLTAEQELSEAIFLALRLREGVNLGRFYEHYQVDVTARFAGELHRLQELGLVQLTDGVLRLTAAGLPLANEVFVNFI